MGLGIGCVHTLSPFVPVSGPVGGAAKVAIPVNRVKPLQRGAPVSGPGAEL
ncbi:hypothetical protein GALL_09670 [mine drainage metagenome]|uniref:Uncharacterized protein n=1 Tax=mine drainage metagenome TaxID=410659 RepID=A0A1J5TQP0_9ZZZZ